MSPEAAVVSGVSGTSSFPLDFSAGLSAAQQRPATNTGSGANTNSNTSNGTPNSATGTTQQPVNSSSILADLASIQNPNLASGQSSGSVLGAYTNDSSLFAAPQTQQSQLLTQIANTAKKRFGDAQTQISATYKQASDNITAVVNQWISVKASINNAMAGVTQGQTSITNANNTLLDMRGIVSNAAQAPVSNAKAFDSDLASINQQADRLGPALNLVGSINPVDWTPNQVQYRNNLGTGVTTLNGGYIGSTYRIMASDGTVWVPDTQANTLTHYSELQGVPQKVTVTDGTNTAQIPETASYQNGIQLVSYDPNTQAIKLQITINPADPPTTVTGTLQQTGIGLMPAWFYGGLTTTAGRQQAFQAINEAQARLSLGGTAVQVAANVTATDQKNADNALNALNAKSADAQGTQLKALQDLQTKYTQQVQAMQNNLNQLSSQQQNYIDAFASQISDD
ncbi:MAG: hypothetical protein EPO08_08360, partial [Rhodospirillaceae bacterium]